MLDALVDAELDVRERGRLEPGHLRQHDIVAGRELGRGVFAGTRRS